MVKYKTNMQELLNQVREKNRLIDEKSSIKIKISEEEKPNADDNELQLNKRIAQVKAQIASLQQTLDSLQDRKELS